MSRNIRHFVLAVAASWGIALGWSQDTQSPAILHIQDFEKRIDDYMKSRKTAEGKLPRLATTGSPDAISHHEHELAKRIRRAREHAKEGDIFTPEITDEFRRLIGLAGQGNGAARIEKSLKRAEPVKLKLHINETYPDGSPLQSMPPTLIMNLPKIPKELDYRVAGHDLILRDAEANLVIDFIPGVMP